MNGAPGAVRAALALAVALAVGGCQPEVEGNGVLREEPRSVPAFLGVSVTDGVQLKATAGLPQRVVVSGDENVVQHVRTSVVTDTAAGIQVLEVSVNFDYTTTHPLVVTVDVPELRLVRARGASEVDARGVAAERLRVEARDGSDVVVGGAGTGAAPALDVVLAGSQHLAHLDARAYPVATATVDLTGSARAELRASVSVSGVARPGTTVENAGSGECLVQDGQGNAVSCLAP